MYKQPNIVNLSLSLKEVSANLLGKSVVQNIDDLYIDAKTISKEFLYLQKCNCVELYFVLDSIPNKKDILCLTEFWAKHAVELNNKLIKSIVIQYGRDACTHLMRVACGLESVIVGDNQVLGQVKNARSEAIFHKSVGSVLNFLLKYSVMAGNNVNKRTLINRGNISVGRVVSNMIGGQEKNDTKNILIVGAGKMGELIANLLSNSIDKNKITIINRTDEKAKIIGCKLQINNEKFESFFKIFSEYSIIIFATSSTHFLINKKILSKVTINNLTTLIDIGNPPNVDVDVKSLPNIKLLNLDYIKEIANLNLENRELCVREAEKIVEEKMNQLEKEYKLLPVYNKIDNIYRNAINRQEKILNYYCKKNNLEFNSEMASRLTFSLLYPIGQIRKLVKKKNDLKTKREINIIIDNFLNGYLD